MKKEYDILPKINRIDLIKAKKYLWVYLHLFITDDMLNNHREIMSKLNSSQQTFLTFCLMDSSMRDGSNGGFLKTIYDKYGEYIFEKPFSRIIKTWGAKKIGRIVENAKSIYEKHKDRIKEVKTEKELSCLCSEITDFEILDDEYMMVSLEETKKIKEYIENNTNEFAIIDENNSQVSYVDISIKEMEVMVKIFEESKILDKY